MSVSSPGTGPSSYSPVLDPARKVWHLPVNRLTIPLKRGPSPMGISTGSTLGESRALTSLKTRSKLACSLSIRETNKMRGKWRWSQASQTFSVPTSTPPVALSTTTAASATARPQITSPKKSR